MGNFINFYKTSSLDMLSDSESESDAESENEQVFESRNSEGMECTIDAVTSGFAENGAVALTIEDIKHIEESLDEYEKVSMMFLLLECNSEKLFTLSNVILYEWVVVESILHDDWQEKILESLSIIKNFGLLKLYGYKRKELENYFCPYYGFYSKHIDKTRKSIYLACEMLSETNQKRFLTEVEEDFAQKGIPMYHFNYMELYFLYWIRLNYIKKNDFHNILKILKALNLDQVYDILLENSNERIARQSSKTTDTYDTPNHHIPNGEISIVSCSNAHEDIIIEKYDTSNRGVCLIINQENFYKEWEPEYKDLLPNTPNPLQNREGTRYDVHRLEHTFKNRNFDVIIKNDQNHKQIIEEVQSVINSITDESCLFVCILSHGDEGVVFGVNSCQVDVSSIREIMCGKGIKNYKLEGKPKVLIIQACQGRECQKETFLPIHEEQDQIEIDGPIIRQPKLYKTDILMFWATVPGYSAVRNKKSGTWFIQDLCEKIDQCGNKYSFEDICVLVTREVSNKQWKKEPGVEYFMVPLKEGTLTKKFYLPR